MVKSLLSKILSVAIIVLCVSNVSKAYDGHSPIQAFIDRERSQYEFKTVNNLWSADNSFTMTDASQYVRSATFFSLDFTALSQFMQNNQRDIDLVITKPSGETFHINLAQYSPFTGSFDVSTCSGGDKLEKYNYTHGLHYRGVVNGIPGSIAAFSFFNGEVYGIFSIPGVGNYTLVPNTLVANGTNNNHYILYNDADLLMQHPKCGNDMLPNFTEEIEKAQNKNVFNSCKEVKMYFRVDYQTYLDKNSNVTLLTNYLSSVFNMISMLYRNEGIYLALHKLIINTTPDTYQSLPQSSFDFLDEFSQLTQNNLYGCDLAMLFTTIGNMGGVAWLDQLCETYESTFHTGPYAMNGINLQPQNAFPLFSWNSGVTSHEIGHNLGSPHTHWCGWVGGAIDGCETLEDGPCSVNGPQYPVNGGTIMSYCDLVPGVGTNFANGFGTQPGNLIRNTVNTASCPVIYAPNVAVGTASVISNANRECTDPSGVTYYWNDGTNADTTGDRIVLKIKKGTNNIGNLDQTGFTVNTTTLASYGGGTGVQFTLPTGMLTGNNFAQRRYWKMTPITQPASEVTVYLPFTNTDVSDVDGSITGTVGINNLKLYTTTTSAVNPDPSAGLTGATTTNLKLYTNGATPSNTVWQSTPVGTTQFAQFKTATLNGGAAFANTNFASIQSIAANNGISIYPNPTKDVWNVTIPSDVTGALTMQLYSVDGRLVQSKTLEAGKVNTINSKTLATGVYFYRVVGAAQTYTGNITKE
jgi:hypothetical protein